MSAECCKLVESLSGSEPLDAQSRAHLESCAECRQAASALRAVADTRPEPASRTLVGFAARVSAAHGGQARRPGPLGAATAVGALAAAALLAVAIVDQPARTTSPGARTETVVAAGEPSSPEDVLAADPLALELEDLLEDPFAPESAFDLLFAFDDADLDFGPI